MAASDAYDSPPLDSPWQAAVDDDSSGEELDVRYCSDSTLGSVSSSAESAHSWGHQSDITRRITTERAMPDARAAAAACNGRRPTYEDAVSIYHGNAGISVYGLFDGHGGAALARYCSEQLPEYFNDAIRLYSGGSATVAQAIGDGDDSFPREVLTGFLRKIQDDAEANLTIVRGSAARAFPNVLPFDLQDTRVTAEECNTLSLFNVILMMGELRRDYPDEIFACGTTALLAWVTQHPIAHTTSIVVANAGDSCAIIVGRSCGTGEPMFTRLNKQHRPSTTDDTDPENARSIAVGMAVTHGRIGPPINNIGVSRALGNIALCRFTTNTPPYARLPPEQQPITWVPEITTVAVESPNIEPVMLLMACDGVWDSITFAQAAETAMDIHARGVRGDVPLEETIARAIVARALHGGPAAGADNTTVLVVLL